MRFLFVFSIVMLVYCPLPGQINYTIKPENADCNKAIEIKDTIWGPTNAPIGYGSIMEILDDKNSLFGFEKEHNTCWYYFRGKNDCLLEIEIIPEKIADDYDFVLYKYSGRTFCQDVAEGKIKPVRTCISRNDKNIGSKTGLSINAGDEFIHSGPGPSFGKYLTIKKGDIYYLCLDNVYPNGGGHTVILHYSGCKKPQITKKVETEVSEQPKPLIPQKIPVKINIVDKDTQKAIKASIRIFKEDIQGTDAVISFDSISECTTELDPDSKYIVVIEANNYFDLRKDIKTSLPVNGKTINIELSRIIVGQNVVFENILFFGNTARILPESKPVLQAIMTTMKRYQVMKIEIQGHVNCPTTWSDCEKRTEFNLQLSISRAKAVFDFLIESGINANRMTYKGFGANKMIYPNARSEDKMEKNRRVEIVVTAF